MALRVLDGNQTATTLSSVVTGGEHIVAHSVVSLGANAIANITSAVSGSVVSISNFPSTQTIAGTVTAILSDQLYDSGTPVFVAAYLDSPGGTVIPVSQDANFGMPISGTVTANTAYSTSVTGTARGGTVTAMPVALVNSGVFGGSILDYNGTNTSLNVSIKRVGQNSLEAVDSTLPVSGTVTVGNSVTIGSLPAISGTVTANGFDFNNSTYNPIPLAPFDETIGGGKAVVAKIIDDGGSGLNFSAGVPISGTVTANGFNYDENAIEAIPIRNDFNDNRYIPIGPSFNDAGDSITLPITGTVTANAILQNATAMAQAFIDESNAYGSVSVVLSGSAGNIGVAGTVTAAAPNGSLTTRFGTPTTANVSFATSAVTNANRKYLLIQNVTTGSNVITVGIGFTPTTTQGIQLTAGAGITFESSYIPTGQIFVLSSVTASNFIILEA